MTHSSSNESLWSKIFRFLKRDIRTFFLAPHNKPCTPLSEELIALKSPTPSLLPLPLLLDLAQLDKIKDRRDTLNLRDELILKLTESGLKFMTTYSDHVEDIMSDVSVWRSIFPVPANEILRPSFDKIIRNKIHKKIKLDEARLLEHANNLKIQKN